MAHTVRMLPAAAPCGDLETGLDRDQPVCILIRHCRDMKQQETRLRLITMLLLLGCSALYIFTLCAELRKTEPQSSGEHHQEKLQAAVSSTEKKTFNIDLRQRHSDHEDPGTDGYIEWEQIIPEDNHHDQSRRDIVIPEDGVYFIYFRTSLICNNATGAALSNMFHMELRSWNANYNTSRDLTETRDGVSCPPVAFRTVSVAQLFDLEEGDHVSVRVGAGYELIDDASFGAVLVERVKDSAH
ncbi:unnamed protein product [Pleuronectes platessa]|uniref:THD domain-containing protein n=1 Tax=Pleuronectes platessa TaxID=8262 RepID=A0A9N7U1T6_PLEPL|nr:unnamed protein product [Pleuronectes platessa]